MIHHGEIVIFFYIVRMQENMLNQEPAQSRKADDEIDILELVGILLAKWPILLVFVLVGASAGFFVSNYIRPAFSSDALLQVDQNGSSAGLALGDMGALLDVASPADAEIQLIQSRRVLEVVVDVEHLSYAAMPVALLPRLLHKEGRVDVGFLHIPSLKFLIISNIYVFIFIKIKIFLSLKFLKFN